MNKLLKKTIKEVSKNYDKQRIPLSSKQRENLKKVFPYYGAQGIIDYVDDYLFDGEYILVAEDGENLKSNNNPICNLVDGKFWVNNHAHIIRANSENNNKYLCYLLNLVNFRPYISGSAQPKLTQDNLNNIELSIHDFNTQTQIAKVLSDLDAKIELNHKINAELEGMAKLIYDYWFVQFEFPFDFAQGKPNEEGKPYKSSGGKMVYNEELKREIPEGWEAGNASDLLKFNPTLSIKKGAKASYIDMNALPTNGFMTKEVQTKEFSGGMKFQNGDVAVARITPCLENGKTALISLLSDDEIGFGSTEFIILRGKKFDLRSFASCLSRSEKFRKYAISKMTGTSGRKRLKADDLALFKMAIPNESILKQFETKISPLFAKMTANTIENQKLSSLRDWLLPMLMNGQVSTSLSCRAESKQTKKGYENKEVELGVAAEEAGEYEK